MVSNMSLFEVLEELDGLADHLFSASGEDRAGRDLVTSFGERFAGWDVEVQLLRERDHVRDCSIHADADRQQDVCVSLLIG